MLIFKPTKKPLTNDKIIISLRMNIDKLEQVDAIAGENDISRNELINQCIEFALEHLEKNSKEEKSNKK